MIESIAVRKVLNNTPEWLLKFFYSDLYLALFALFVFLSWVTNQPVIGILAITVFGTIVLIITSDLTPALPLLAMACCIFATSDISSYLIYLVIFIPLIAAFVFHFVYYPPSLRRGRMFFPQLAITFALLIAGCDCISKESYLSTLGYVLLLGVLVLALYLLYNAYYRKNS